MSSFGILSYGAYAPVKRMSRAAIFEAVGWAQPSLRAHARGARAFGQWDEDALTMAVEAARAAILAAPAGARVPGGLTFASTTAPFLDRSNAGVIAAALDFPEDMRVADAAGSQRAASSALIGLAAERPDAALLVAADRRPTKPASAMEMLSGDAGAAVLLGQGDPVAEIVGTFSVRADLVDHYRTVATGVDYSLEERWLRDIGMTRLVRAAFEGLRAQVDFDVTAVSAILAPAPNPALSAAAAEAVGAHRAKAEDGLFIDCGHAGAAQPLLALAAALDAASPGDLILMLIVGQGCDAILLRATKALGAYPARGAARAALFESRTPNEDNYARFLSAAGNLDLDWGLRAERDNRTAQTVAFNKSRDIYGFVGGLCRACQTPQFPRSRRCVNPDCAALDAQEPYRFAERRASVKSFTEDWLAFTRAPPLVYGNVSFEGGGAAFMEMTGFAPGAIAIGTPLRMTFRIKDFDNARGFRRYFWKAAPAAGGEHG